MSKQPRCDEAELTFPSAHVFAVALAAAVGVLPVVPVAFPLQLLRLVLLFFLLLLSLFFLFLELCQLRVLSLVLYKAFFF
jgi:hypothetical protein